MWRDICGPSSLTAEGCDGAMLLLSLRLVDLSSGDQASGSCLVFETKSPRHWLISPQDLALPQRGSLLYQLPLDTWPVALKSKLGPPLMCSRLSRGRLLQMPLSVRVSSPVPPHSSASASHSASTLLSRCRPWASLSSGRHAAHAAAPGSPRHGRRW